MKSTITLLTLLALSGSHVATASQDVNNQTSTAAVSVTQDNSSPFFNGLSLNGMRFNGFRVNGFKMNGIALNGIKLQGKASVSNSTNINSVIVPLKPVAPITEDQVTLVGSRLVIVEK